MRPSERKANKQHKEYKKAEIEKALWLSQKPCIVEAPSYNSSDVHSFGIGGNKNFPTFH